MKMTTGKTRNAKVTLTMSVAEANILLELASRMATTDAHTASGLYRASLVNAMKEYDECRESLRNIGS